MNAIPVSASDSARRREDVLRELNLFPLWQLRTPVSALVAETVATTPVIPEIAELKIEQAAVTERPQADIATLNWAELKMQVKNCTACKLRAGCLQTVFGTGDETADWLFVGSWPTEDDETTGEAFAGQAGQLLDNMLAAIQLKRGSRVYLSNVVKCCGAIKRGPQADEIAQCSPYLARQIQLLQPKMIVALGHAAATALLGEDREWDSLLGKVHEFRCFADDHENEKSHEKVKNSSPQAIPLIITHHPAALLLTPLNKAQTWRDLCLARDTMQSLAREAEGN